MLVKITCYSSGLKPVSRKFCLELASVQNRAYVILACITGAYELSEANAAFCAKRETRGEEK